MHLQYLLLGKVMYYDVLFSNVVGNGSRSQDLFWEDMIIFLTSSVVAGVKEASREFTYG